MKIKYVITLNVLLFVFKIANSVMHKNSDQTDHFLSAKESQMPLAMMSDTEFKTSSLGKELSPSSLNLNLNAEWTKPKYEGSANTAKFEANDASQVQTFQRLNELNKQLDEELSKLKPNVLNHLSQMTDTNPTPRFSQVYSNFPTTKINGFDSTALTKQVDFTNSEVSPMCIRREGMLKIRDVDQRDKDVVVTYAVLTKDRLSYFVNVKDESSIQGSIELARIKESLKLINGFPTCFTIKTIDGVSDCSVCAESEDSAREWINAVTQNAVNCNTISVLSNMKKRGILNL